MTGELSAEKLILKLNLFKSLLLFMIGYSLSRLKNLHLFKCDCLAKLCDKKIESIL